MVILCKVINWKMVQFSMDIWATIYFFGLVVTKSLFEGLPLMINGVFIGDLKVMKAGWFLGDSSGLEIIVSFVTLFGVIIPRLLKLIKKLRKRFKG